MIYRNLMRSFLSLFFLTILTGLFYPLLVTSIAQIAMPHRANGSLVWSQGRVVGSSLIAQRFKREGYFWPRPSAVDYHPLPAGASNLAQTSARLADQVENRRKALTEAHGATEIPEDLLFASGSGIDPHISKNAAYFQLSRVAHARGWNEAEKERVRSLVDSLVEHNPRIFPGEPGVNVLMLNLALDKLSKNNGAVSDE